MAYTNRIAWETLRSIDSATFNSTYLPLGTPLLFPSYKLKLVNNSTVLVTVSIDGVHAVDVVPANSFFLYDETQAQFNTANFPAIPAGTQISVNGIAGTGLVYLVSQYLITN